jgi:hypothetical protein
MAEYALVVLRGITPLLRNRLSAGVLVCVHSVPVLSRRPLEQTSRLRLRSNEGGWLSRGLLIR